MKLREEDFKNTGIESPVYNVNDEITKICKANNKKVKGKKTIKTNTELQLMKQIALKDIPDPTSTLSILKCTIFRMYLDQQISTVESQFEKQNNKFQQDNITKIYFKLKSLGYTSSCSLANEIILIFSKTSELSLQNRTFINQFYAEPSLKSTYDLYDLIAQNKI